MRTLTYTAPESSEADCPPEDIYTLEVVSIGDFVEKPAFKFNPEDPEMINTQSRIEFQVADFDYDPDMDDRDWNGAKVADFYVFYKRNVATGNESETWKSERANSNKLLKALIGRDLDEGEDIDLQSFIGRRIKATVAPKSSGWPKITNPMKVRQKRAAKPAKPEGESPFEDDEVA